MFNNIGNMEKPECCQNIWQIQKQFWLTCMMGGVYFVENYFVDTHFVDTHFVESSFRRKFISSKVRFVESSFHRKFISSKVHFVESLFHRKFISSKIHFFESSFRQQSLHRKFVSSTIISSTVHFVDLCIVLMINEVMIVMATILSLNIYNNW
jgi:hypothetical protein